MRTVSGIFMTSIADGEDASQMSGDCMATVASWRDQHGWGMLRSPDTPGGCLVEFRSILVPGRRTLRVGQRVHLYWLKDAASEYRASLVVPESDDEATEGS